jgi:uncharacterized OB-fold protein
MSPSRRFEPQPAVTALTEPFWAGGLAGELRLQQCRRCHHIRYPIAEICPRCLSPDVGWTVLSGAGTVLTFTIFQRAYHEAWRERVPYVVALVELDEGPVFLTNIVGVEPARVAVGQRVVVAFEERSAGAALPQFRLTEQPEAG